MHYKNYLKGITLVFLCTGLIACTKSLKDETISSAGYDQIRKNWTLKNAAVSDDNILLEKDGATVISKFTVGNFDLKMKLKTTPGAEGSLAFHATPDGAASQQFYSVFINNSEYRSGNAQKTGSLSLIRNFFVRMANDDEWFDLGLSVRSNHITVTVNGKIVTEYYEPESPLRLEGLEDMVLSEGRFVLCKSGDPGSIFVSEITIEALSDDIPREIADFETTDEVAEQLTLLNQKGFPVIDFHGHLKRTLTMDQITKYGRDHGFNYGIAENCGLSFPVTDDASLNEYYNDLVNEPVFKAMQCEGREWVTLFSPQYIEQFDYIFTDAMTFTDHRGRRMRLWVRSEVVVESEEQFIDMMVGKILGILSQEPVDIYVNPTYLPAEISQNYDKLWTPERMDRVISALIEYDVALEINSRFRVPGIEFMKRAKAAGVKFTFGTNNAGANDLGRLEYCIQAIREVGITPEDMFLPKPAGQKKVSFMGLPEKPTG